MGLHGPCRRHCEVGGHMSSKPADTKPLAATIKEHWADKLELGGTGSGYVACYAANQVLGTVWRGDQETPDTKEIRDTATLGRLSDIGSRDVIEGMLAAQMVAVHEAAMEAFRRAALAEQTFAGREMGLKYGAKLSRTYAALLETLDRHRGKGQPQVVRVERVTVEAGGRAHSPRPTCWASTSSRRGTSWRRRCCGCSRPPKIRRLSSAPRTRPAGHWRRRARGRRRRR